MDQQTAGDLCHIVLPTLLPLSSATSPNCFYTEHHYVKQACETHLCALNKAAVENAVPYITRCFFMRTRGNNSCLAHVNNSQNFPRQLVCIYLKDLVNRISDKFPLFHWQPRGCGLCKQQMRKNTVFAELPAPVCSFLLSRASSLLIYTVLSCFLSHCKPPEKHSVKEDLLYTEKQINKMCKSSTPCFHLFSPKFRLHSAFNILPLIDPRFRVHDSRLQQ